MFVGIAGPGNVSINSERRTQSLATYIRNNHSGFARETDVPIAGLLTDLAARHEVRFAKPAGVAYADLYEMLDQWTSLPGVSLWRRMMVLGPPPEFCLVTPIPLQLPAEMSPEVLSRSPL